MVSVSPATVPVKLVAPVVSSGMTTALELRNPTTVKSCPTNTPQPCAFVPPEAWIQVQSSDYSPPNGYIRDSCKKKSKKHSISAASPFLSDTEVIPMGIPEFLRMNVS